LLFGAMIGGSTNDLNENEYVSRDVERTAKAARDQAVGLAAR
jgi:hypothetical protein